MNRLISPARAVAAALVGTVAPCSRSGRPSASSTTRFALSPCRPFRPSILPSFHLLEPPPGGFEVDDLIWRPLRDRPIPSRRFLPPTHLLQQTCPQVALP